ncbi:hypothetical protein [uncultured Dubosiella sp.]|uniref:hypothetical protein n=2 Tax=uncultured Dubosiella sp. TaxID=1937011 RepID=UPI0025A59FB0|nr:hypothetical protein [uncultured Dubosiella sp.]
MPPKFKMKGTYRRWRFEENRAGEIELVDADIFAGENVQTEGRIFGYESEVNIRPKYRVMFIGNLAKEIMKVHDGTILSVEGEIFKSPRHEGDFGLVVNKFKVIHGN